MTKYYKKLDENGAVELLLSYNFVPTITDERTMEVTEEEYEALSAELNPPHEPVVTDNISGREFVQMLEAVL